MKIKSFSLALALTVTSPVFAAMSDAQLVQAMRADFNKYLVTFKTPKIIFHWTDASDITPMGQFNESHPGTAPSFKAFVDKQGAKVFRARDGRDSDIEGPGLYLASDPLSTRHYGGQRSFGLIVGLIKPGAKIMPGGYMTTMSTAVQLEVEKRGCTVSTYAELLDVADDKRCTKMKQLFVGNTVEFADARFYSYGGSNVEGCRQRSPYKELNVSSSKLRDYEGLDTFVVFSSRTFSEVLGITHRTKTGSHAFTNEVLSYLKGLQVNKLTNYASFPIVSQEQLNDSGIKAMSKADIAKFSQKYILGCNL